MTEREYYELLFGNAIATAHGTNKTMENAAGSGANGVDVLEALVKSTVATLIKEITAGEKTGTEVIDLEALFPAWKKEGKAGDGWHQVGEVVSYNSQVVKCCQAHNTNHNPDITPESMTFFVPFHTTDPAKAKEFVQPIHAESAYYIGEVCIFEDTIKRCKMDGCTYAPDVYPDAWETVEKDVE